MKTRLIIFDMDGTLLDTLQDLADCTNYILDKNGYPTHPLDAYRYFVGNGIRVLIERALPEQDRNEQRIEEVFQEFIPYYEKHKEDMTKPYDGIIPLLEELGKRGVLLSIASNKVQQAMDPLVAHYFPGIHFAAVLGNRNGIPPKPDPTIVEDILKITGVSKIETLYIGDTAVDMKTAAAAGIYKIGVLWGFRNREELEQAGADAIVAHPDEILHYLKH